MKTCPFCQTEAPESSQFCAACGKSLSPVQAAPVSSEPASPYAPSAESSGTVSPYAPPVNPLPIQTAPAHSQPVQPPAGPNRNPASIEGGQSAQPTYHPITQSIQPACQPVMHPPGWDTAPPESPQKSQLPRILGIGAAVLVLAGITAAAFLLFSPNPQTKAESAVEKTQKAWVAQLEAVSNAMGGGVLSQAEEDPSFFEFQMDLSKAVPSLPEGQWVKVKNYNDPEQELSNVQIENSFGIDADLFADSENLTLSAPELLSYPIAFSYQMIEQKIADGSIASPFVSAPPTIDDYYDWDNDDYYDWDSDWGIEAFAHTGYSGTGRLAALMVPMAEGIVDQPGASLFSGLGGLGGKIDFEAYEERLAEAAEELEESAEYQAPQKVTYPGFNDTLESITVIYPDAAANTYVNECASIIMELAKEISPDLPGQMQGTVPTVSASNFSKTIMIQSGYACVYILEMRLTVQGEAVDFTLTFQTKDGKNPLNEWSAEAVGISSGTKVLEVTVNGSGRYTAESGLDYTVVFLSSGSYAMSQSLTAAIQYNPTLSDDNITVSVQDSRGMRFGLSGNLRTEESAVTLKISRIDYKLSEYGESGEYVVDAALRLEITEGYQGKPVPSGAKDGFTLTEEEWQEILMNAMLKIYAGMGTFTFE